MNSPVPQKNSIKLMLNGNSSLFIYMKLLHGLTMKDIEEFVKDKWKKKIKRFRLFTSEGVELFNDELEFIKQGKIYYVSRGEDFDQFSCFSEYDLVKKLGEGGFGKVYLGVHKLTGHKVAIKIINSGLIGNAQEIELVFREAEALVSLNHKNIVKILNFYTMNNMQVAIIMEYLEGGELLKYLEEKGKLDENEAREFFIQLLDAIAYCHKEKIVHRDLKLENILISDIGKKTIKIVDFGIASLWINSNFDTLSAGTLKYMAPELFLKKSPNASSSIDIWSMGCILYALILGTLPFIDTTRSLIKEKIMNENVQFRGLCGKEVKDLICKMLEKDPIKRISLGGIYNHPWVKGEILSEEKPKEINENLIDEIKKKNVIFKPLNNKLEKNLKKMTHIKRNSALATIQSKENTDSLETPKLYESLIRGGRQNLLELKLNKNNNAININDKK